MWTPTNLNPRRDRYNRQKRSGDCTIRAIALATGQTWEHVYWMLAWQGFIDGEMPSGNATWGNYLKSVGFSFYRLPDTCPSCYTVYDFALDNPYGTYVLGTGDHAVAVINGVVYDAWDSRDEIPIYLYTKDW